MSIQEKHLELFVEAKRRNRVAELNGAAAETEVNASAMIQSGEIDPHRARLEEAHGKIWTLDEVQEEFDILFRQADMNIVSTVGELLELADSRMTEISAD